MKYVITAVSPVVSEEMHRDGFARWRDPDNGSYPTVKYGTVIDDSYYDMAKLKAAGVVVEPYDVSPLDKINSAAARARVDLNTLANVTSDPASKMTAKDVQAALEAVDSLGSVLERAWKALNERPQPGDVLTSAASEKGAE